MDPSPEDPEPPRITSDPVGNPTQGEREDQAHKSREPGDVHEREEGEIHLESSSEEDSNIEHTPQKQRRGRKSKIAEREKETYKDVLNGS